MQPLSPFLSCHFNFWFSSWTCSCWHLDWQFLFLIPSFSLKNPPIAMFPVITDLFFFFLLCHSLSCSPPFVPSSYFWLHRQRLADSGVRWNQERSGRFGRLPLPRGLCLHQHPRGQIPERQRRSSASVPLWTLPHLSGYSCKLSCQDINCRAVSQCETIRK